MSNKALYFIILFVCSFCSKASSEQYYSSCNIYTSDVCFGINKGDSIEMKTPADFILYTVVFGFDADAIIYYGYQPQKLPKTVLHKQQIKIDSGVSHAIKIAENKYRFQYRSAKSQKTIDVSISLTNSHETSKVLSFLENFRVCNRKGFSIECEDEKVFKGLTLN